ncbi:hypothetical protein EBB59_01705 [Lysobacter pythonis]|uniref:Uncharacterized protein n=1 Tax=Solilutibacter pythonis TaxID=2483112 RepID=A0A3M2HXI1_9GAMM|nr:hypothetical protein EBB59_01705 [Lysobacter pythonis]
MAASTAGTNGHAVAVEVDGVRYPSARSAAQALGVGYSMVTARAHDPRHPDYRWLGATPAKRQVHDPATVRMGRELIAPARWPNDGGARRTPVMDTNFDPPRLVRWVGWLRCMCCGRPHFSEDVARARVCVECGGSGGWAVGVRPDRDA